VTIVKDEKKKKRKIVFRFAFHRIRYRTDKKRRKKNKHFFLFVAFFTSLGVRKKKRRTIVVNTNIRRNHIARNNESQLDSNIFLLLTEIEKAIWKSD
jgi:hypothetical protein